MLEATGAVARRALRPLRPSAPTRHGSFRLAVRCTRSTRRRSRRVRLSHSQSRSRLPNCHEKDLHREPSTQVQTGSPRPSRRSFGPNRPPGPDRLARAEEPSCFPMWWAAQGRRQVNEFLHVPNLSLSRRRHLLCQRSRRCHVRRRTARDERQLRPQSDHKAQPLRTCATDACRSNRS